ncbi:MAG: phospho-sugar mutase, partial [Clostridiaceae bacterium]|nr:phospho-sugar mutase [Clostridiaceae bacterium]
WTENPAFDDATRDELKAIAGDKVQIEDRFYQDLQFGTAGLRGIMGAGSNRMNVYTVARAAAGFAESIKQQGEEAAGRGVAVSYDSRNNSRLFAELAARIFVSRGLTVHFSDELRPVPLLSFAIRHFNCAGGVMITASHNPKEYNGFKAFAADGAQLGPDAADSVSAEMDKITDLPGVIADSLSIEEARHSRLWHDMGDDLDAAYDEALLQISLQPDIVEEYADIPIVYTPLYGAGNKPVRRILAKTGFENVHVVKEQELPNGNFPSTPFPNPELPETLNLAIELAKELKAPLVMATDPDADRVGIAVPKEDGSYYTLLGNEIGILLLEYILSSKKDLGILPENSFVVSSIVSGRLTDRICAAYDCDLYRVLTGFKFIAEAIHEHEDLGDGKFQFGYEEAFGYLAGSSVRDKDAVVSGMLLAEMAAVAAKDGETLLDRLNRIYADYGYAAENTVSIVREGKSGSDMIKSTMSELRSDPFDKFHALPIESLSDFEKLIRIDVASNEESVLAYDRSNVLLYEMEGIDFFCIRPSGTEPKIKIYFGCYADTQEECDKNLKLLSETVLHRIECLMGEDA